MYMYERGTLASALIFSAKPLTDNNVEVKSLEGVGGGGKTFLLLVTLGSV